MELRRVDDFNVTLRPKIIFKQNNTFQIIVLRLKLRTGNLPFLDFYRIIELLFSALTLNKIFCLYQISNVSG